MIINCKRCGWKPKVGAVEGPYYCPDCCETIEVIEAEIHPEDTFFIEHGKYFLKTYSYGEIDEFTIEELYQAFKKRFIRESG